MAAIMSTIETLKRELAALEAQYKVLLGLQQDPQLEEEEEEETSPKQSHSLTSTSALLLFHRYKHLTQLNETLYHENEELYRMNNARMLVEARLQTAFDLFEPPSVARDLPCCFRFHELPIEFYRHEILRCRDQALRFADYANPLCTGVDVCGWKDCGHVRGASLDFALEKCFANVSAFSLMNATWSWLVNPATNTKMYSANMKPTVRILQQIDQDTVLFYWSLQPPVAMGNTAIILKSLFVLSRLAIPGGYMIGFRSIDKDALRFEDDDDASTSGAQQPYWAVMNNWIVIREVAPNVVKYQFGGSTKAKLWAVEILLICMRWETHVLGTRRTA